MKTDCLNKPLRFVVLSIIAGWTLPASANAPATPPFELVTLGTVGGPLPNTVRGQPANLLTNGSDSFLIDCGDGAAERLAAAGANFPSLRAIFLTHHHFDHIGGLFAVLGLRFQLDTQGPLTIYGPRGTATIVKALLAAMGPSAEARYGVPGERFVSPADNIDIVELTDGSVVKLDGTKISVALNSHYSFDPGSADHEKHQSLSYRFDLPTRSIVFTGDTGPSSAVEKLAYGADVLVAEMIDLPNTLKKLEAFARDLPPHIKVHMAEHFEKQHLVPAEVGKMASRARVGAVIVTHLAGTRDEDVLDYLSDIARNYSGPTIVSSDMQRH
jgi:ribonuclease BN (tRNA processing enzyme)